MSQPTHEHRNPYGFRSRNNSAVAEDEDHIAENSFGRQGAEGGIESNRTEFSETQKLLFTKDTRAPASFTADGQPVDCAMEPTCNEPLEVSNIDGAFNGVEIEGDRPKPSFGHQLKATMVRMIQLQRREPVSACVEFFIPVIFVVGSIIIWAIFGNGTSEAASYVDASAADDMRATLRSVGLLMCYNGPTPIGTLAACSTVTFPSPEMKCVPDGMGIPSGFCFDPSMQYIALISLRAFVKGTTAVVPTLDEIIPLQWVNQYTYSQGGIGDVYMYTETSSLVCSGTLYFAPASSAATDLMNHFLSTSVYFQYINGGVVDTVANAEEKVKVRTDKDPPNWGILQIDAMSATEFDVSIRLNASALPSTKRLVGRYYLGGIEDDSDQLYVFSGFTTLQKTIYDYYLATYLALPAINDVVLIPMATAAYDTQKFLAYGGQLAPLIIVLGFLYPVSQLAKRLVVEKELRLREAMLIMGLSESVMYIAWFIVNFGQYIIINIIMTVLLKVTYLKRSNFGIIFFLLLFFLLSMLMLSGLISTFFSKSRLAALFAPLIYFILAIPLFAMQSTGDGANYGISILSPSGLAVGISILFSHEMTGGMRGSDLNYFRDRPSMIYVLCILVADAAIYLLLMLYLDAVIPKDWGTAKHPLFFIIDPCRALCCRRSQGDDDNGEDGRAENGVFEEVDDSESSAVRIVGLRKKYRTGGKSFLAVNNLHLALREGEVSVLLGHNGAGKTTTMNMMTGMIKADAGDCYIYGKSVSHDLTGARQEIGYCPQHNILWPQLTCREHLEYYAEIKGLSGKRRDAAVVRMLEAVDLHEKMEYKAKRLSGGQKRKLSVAIAFVGGSRLVFLDEPTAGMDVGARRHSWGLIKRMSESHTILLTTHYMDEADLLGNSIAIMSKGRLQCCGSSMFLKSRLGVGYNIIMSVKPHVDRRVIDRLVLRHIKDAHPIVSGAGEMAFRLPNHTKSSFPALLSAIETDGPNVGVNGFSLSATTLEEIFIKVAEGIEEEEEDSNKEQTNMPASKTVSMIQSSEVVDTSSQARTSDDNAALEEELAEVMEERREGCENAAAEAAKNVWNVRVVQSDLKWTMMQLQAMMLKRFWNSMRDRRTQFFQIVCPVVCVLLAMLLTLVKIFNSPTIVLTSDLYDADVVIDTVNCDPFFDLSVPFSSRAETVVPPGVTAAPGLDTYFLDTYSNLGKERYGSFSCADTTFTSQESAIFYNYSSPHEIAIGMANYYRAYVQKSLGSAFPMKTSVAAMPKTEQEKAYSSSIYSVMISVVIMIPFTFIPSTFVGWIVKERECKARHLQSVSGLGFSVYWISNFLFDICSYIVTMFLVIIIFAIFNRKEYIGRDNVGATIVLFFLYGVSGVTMAYALSFLFSEHSSAQNIVMLANFITGFLLVLAVGMLIFIESTENVAKILRWIFRVVPSYCVGEGIMNLAVLQSQQAFGYDKTAWDMSCIGWPCVYMAIELPFFFFITLFIDHPARRQRSQRLFHSPDAEPEHVENEDDDVVAESKSIFEDEDRANDLVTVKHLRKQYPNGKVAVKNLTFGVKPGEVFGFLGTNGAGKTTTISILCQEFYPTSGHASICGYDIVKNSREALRCIGYCPQFDATLDLLTVEEHLYLYARVRGILSEDHSRIVKGLMDLCQLVNYRSTTAHRLSGGNRRKLSVAISLIGGPRVVFLDEPSAGMDPVARRGLWTAIQTVSDNCSVVLTTHHLEEVEALAHRVAIMVDGTLRCIGDKTHLKSKYGSGFEVNVRIASDREAQKAALEAFFAENFPDSTLNEYRSQRYTYALPQSTQLSQAFSILEANKQQLNITDYTVSQTSIEQVFLRISEAAEQDNHEEEEKVGCCTKFWCCCCRCCSERHRSIQ